MESFHARKLSVKQKGLRHKLLIVEALIFVLPFLIVSYIFYRNSVLLDFSQIAIVALTLILILAGLIILRQIFDRFFMVATLMRKAQDGDRGLIDMQQDTAELHEITVSFNNLMRKFEETASELQRRVFELFSIKELTEVASKSLDIDDLLNLLLEKAMAVSRAQTGSVFMVESEKQRFSVVASRGLEPEPKKGSYIKIDESLARFVVSEKKPILVQDIETDSRTRKPNDPKYGPPSFLSMPVSIREDVIAVLNLSHKETEQVFDANDEQILSIMIGEIDFALENATLHSRLEEHLTDLQERTAELISANDQLQQEITERKQAEKALRESRAKSEAILDAIPDLMFRITRNGEFLDFKAGTIKELCVLPEEFMGKKISDVMPSEFVDLCHHSIRKTLDSGTIQIFEYLLPMPHGLQDYEARLVASGADEVVAIVRNITDSKRAEEQIKASLREKDVLLREIHHRVKNNLQVISSLLDLSSMRTSSQETIDLCKEMRAKIHTMSLIHTLLYRSERFDKIDMGSYVQELMDYLSQTFGKKSTLVTPVIEPSEVYLSVTEAVPCALVLNEAISNAFKHAFREGQKGTIRISLKSAPEERIFIRVKDDGIGMPEEIDFDKTNGLGLKLMRAIVREQLMGEIRLNRDQGTDIFIEFKALKGEGSNA